MSETAHIAEKDLLLFLDGELEGAALRRVEAHLEACEDCRSRLEKLRSGLGAYEKYHEQVLKPSSQPPLEWPQLRFASATTQGSKSWFHLSRWWAAAWAAILIFASLLFYQSYQRREPSQGTMRLLQHAMNAPVSPHKRLRIRANGRSWYRPAVLKGGADVAGSSDDDLEQTRALFVRANYSWDDPLSARSFAAWRSQLHEKRDQVMSLRGEDGNERFYRLRTETGQGALRWASLTLNAHTLSPVEGLFHFEDRQEVTMADSGDMPAQPEAVAKINPNPDRVATETKATSEDELRVFAALNAIGADAGEPVTVQMDSTQQHVVVTAVGIAEQQEREIRQALIRIPNTTLRFDMSQPGRRGKANAASSVYSPDASELLRRELESKAGGAQNFQEIADRTLDGSSSLLAQAHALDVLAQQFPPAVEAEFGAKDRLTLKSLRLSHAMAVEQAISQVRSAMNPLLAQLPPKPKGSGETQSLPQPSWQSGAEELFLESKLLDQHLNRLLAGSSTQQAGQETLNRLPDAIQSMEKLARSAASVP